MELMTYKCPNCGAPIVFSGEKQQFICESCDSVFTQSQLKEYDKQLKASEGSEPAFHWEQSDEQTPEGMTSYICQFCGAQILGDATTAATECPYCNNPIIMTQQLTGRNRPDCLIPFRVDKKAANDILSKFCKGKILLPKEFKTENHIKKITGVYVPFWLFDCAAAGTANFNATHVRRWSDKNYNYVQTKEYLVTRSGTIEFEKIPVDGSTKMADAYMDAIEPFDYSALTNFDPAFISGYLAEKYDVGVDASAPRANERVTNSTVDALRSTVGGYNSVSEKSRDVSIASGRVRYALLPVWMLNTKYKDKTYTFAINGQTGKLVGELPIDKGKLYAWFFGIAAAVVAIGQFFVFYGG